MGDGGVACAAATVVTESFPPVCGTAKHRVLAFPVPMSPEKRVVGSEFLVADLMPERYRKGELEEGELLLNGAEALDLEKPCEGSLKKLPKCDAEAGEFVPVRAKKGAATKSKPANGTSSTSIKSNFNKIDDRAIKVAGKVEHVATGKSLDGCQSDNGSLNGRDEKQLSLLNEKEPGEIGEDCVNWNSKGWSKWPADENAEPLLVRSLKRPNDGDQITKDAATHSNNRQQSYTRHQEQALLPEASHDKHRRSPTCFERSSPHRRNRVRVSHDRYQHGTGCSDRSPHDRSRGCNDRHRRSPSYSVRSPSKNRRHHRSPSYSERSPSHDRSRASRDKHRHSPSYSDRSPSRSHLHQFNHQDSTPPPKLRKCPPNSRDRTPTDRSPRQRGRHNDHHREKSSLEHRRSVGDRESGKNRSDRQGREKHERPDKRDHVKKDSALGNSSVQKNKSSGSNGGSANKERVSDDKKAEDVELPPPPLLLPPLPPPPPTSSPPTLPPPPPLTHQFQTSEEPSSMEEDMDICDTPPHVTATTEFKISKWFYLDSFGMEQGPSGLDDLKRLMTDGYLFSDHLIKHADSNRWMTLENATSPLIPLNSPSSVSDVAKMVSPPEAPGNLLVESSELSEDHNSYVSPVSAIEHCLEDFRIHDRVEALLDGCSLTDGNELEILGEALNWKFYSSGSDELYSNGGFIQSGDGNFVRQSHPGSGLTTSMPESLQPDFQEIGPFAPSHERECTVYPECSSEWFAGRWSCKGGDWQRNDGAFEDLSYRKKLVLNESYPLCQMLKCSYEDPRVIRKDDAYLPLLMKKLELPPWAFSSADDDSEILNDVKNAAIPRPLPNKQMLPPKGVKGTVLSVVRINACVVSEPSVESRSKARGGDRHPSRSSRSHSIGSDRSSAYESTSHSRKPNEQELQSLPKSKSIPDVPMDHVRTFDELSVSVGDWFYLDGTGQEQGPFSYKELQEQVNGGTIRGEASVFRKIDNTWVPIARNLKSREVPSTIGDSALTSNLSQSNEPDRCANYCSNSFHKSHPQFIGYMRGKLHELVMRSYKNRELASAINEVLDPWITARQPKETGANYSLTRSYLSQYAGNHWLSEDSLARAAKRAKIFCDQSDEDSDLSDDQHVTQKNDWSFEDICGDISLAKQTLSPRTENKSWELMDTHILARIFHFMRADMKSLLSAAVTCRHWNTTAKLYKNATRLVDFSVFGPMCTDSVLRSVMDSYNKNNVKYLVLSGCYNVGSIILEEILQLFPQICYVDIRGCSQFKDLKHKYVHLKWISSSGSISSKRYESSQKIRSLKQITGKSYQLDQTDNWSDPRKSRALSRDAQMRRLMQKRTENAYKRTQQFVSNRLREIMRANRSDFFTPKVERIENKIKNGYYLRRGLSSIKDDISRMCREAWRSKARDAGDMKQTIVSFIQLAKKLDGGPTFLSEKDEMMIGLKDKSELGLYSSESKYRRKQTKILGDKQGSSRSSVTDGIDDASVAFDREIKRSLSKLKKKDIDSGSDTSDDVGDLSGDNVSDTESTASDTESEADANSYIRDVKVDGGFKLDESVDSIAEEREWGARMTNSSFVPPVTRKYVVIDQYLIVIDEEEVQRKMHVSLPDDSTKELLLQEKILTHIDFPEVKEYRPRKKPGCEVLEQEVYGIDPYTHNLLLDSMPEDNEWDISEKQLFIEQFILNTLNKQVRHFTGTGNAPMTYHLKPVVEEIQKEAEIICDFRTVKMCTAILKAIRTRTDDTYVAYRKGLGVVCNKENGFGTDDFVVEFLGEVYPTWRWFEKQDGIRLLQKNSQEPPPEFYNIYLERPKGDRDGYDLLVVDAMHKANYASRICHSCRPNCEAKVTAVDGKYQIGIYTVRPIAFGEEITFDYNSVTESKEEHEAAICLCGSQGCKGSYLSLRGEDAFDKIMQEYHGVLDRHKLMLQACEANSVSKEDYVELARVGLGSCLLADLPDWLVAYTANLVRFMNFEREKLPGYIFRHTLEEKRKFNLEFDIDSERADSQVQAEGVHCSRLQNVALTLDKVRYVMRRIFGDPRRAPPPLEKLSAEDVVSLVWKGEGSLVDELLCSVAPHMDSDRFSNLKSKIRTHDPTAHDPTDNENLQRQLQKSLLWLRDELRTLQCTHKCRHDAAADLIHIYAYTKCFYKVQEYKSVKSPPVQISPLDLGPKCAEKLGSGLQEYSKTYGENYCLGQLVYWYSQANADPDCRLERAGKGCLYLPEISSFYAKSLKTSRERVYGTRTVRFMLSRMEKQPQRPWPKDRIWTFRSRLKFFGSPMLDAVLNNTSLDREMVHWLKTRPNIFRG